MEPLQSSERMYRNANFGVPQRFYAIVDKGPTVIIVDRNKGHTFVRRRYGIEATLALCNWLNWRAAGYP